MAKSAEQKKIEALELELKNQQDVNCKLEAENEKLTQENLNASKVIVKLEDDIEHLARFKHQFTCQSHMTIQKGLGNMLFVVNNIECDITRASVVKQFIASVVLNSREDIEKREQHVKEVMKGVDYSKNLLSDIERFSQKVLNGEAVMDSKF